MPFYSRDNQALTPRVNWSDPLNRGLVAWWPAQPASRVLRDIAAASEGLNCTPADYTSVSDGFNPESRSRSLTLSDTYYSASSAPAIGSVASVFAWINLGTFDATNGNGAVGVGNSYDSNDGFLLWVRANANLDGGFYDSTSTLRSATIETDYGLNSTGEWHFAGWTYDGSMLQTYLDAAPSGSLSHSGSIGTISNQSFIGGYDGSPSGAADFAWDGSISDVRIYDRALSESEVWSLYQASRQGYPDQFRKRSTIVTSFAAPTDVEPVAYPIIRTRTPRQVQPSYKSGYARTAAESAYPGLWDGLVGAWMPDGNNNVLRDLVGSNDGYFVDVPASDVGVSAGRQSFSTSNAGGTYGAYARIDNFADYGIGNWPMTISGTTNTYSTSGSGMVVSILATWSVSQYKNLSNSDSDGWWWQGTRATSSLNENTSAVDTLNEWNSWSAHWGSSTYRTVSIDGKEVLRSTATSPTPAVPDAILLGQLRVSSTTSQGWHHFQIVMLHNRELSPQEIQILHLDPLAPFRKRSNVILSAVDGAAPPPAGGYRIYENYYRQLLAGYRGF